MGEVRSGSSPRRIQVRPPSWVIQISTVAGPLGPASSTAYWSLNRGLFTSRVFEPDPAACADIAVAGRGGSDGEPVAGGAAGLSPAPAGRIPEPPSGGAAGLVVGNSSGGAFESARGGTDADAATVADAGAPGSRSHAGAVGRARFFAPPGDRGLTGAVGADGADAGRLGGASSSTGVKP
jgi:hypothetical protein